MVLVKLFMVMVAAVAVTTVVVMVVGQFQGLKGHCHYSCGDGSGTVSGVKGPLSQVLFPLFYFFIKFIWTSSAYAKSIWNTVWF